MRTHLKTTKNLNARRMVCLILMVGALITVAGCAKASTATEKAAPANPAVAQNIKDRYICPETGMTITESQKENAACPTGDKVIELVGLMQGAGWTEDKIMSYLGLFVAGRPLPVANVGDLKQVIGSPNAPVTMVEFTDMQCPYCKRYNSDTFPKIRELYVDTGKVKYYHVNFPLPMHRDAQKAAEALYCALDQGKFWEMRSVVFSNQASISVDAIKGYAQNLGMDMKAFNECLDGGKSAERVEKDKARTQAAGVTGTPGFLIGATTPNGMIKGKLISGAQPLQAFQQELDRLLGGAPK